MGSLAEVIVSAPSALRMQNRQRIRDAAPRLCVIVSGAHRTGTSAITRVINLLGADVAPDLVPTKSDNITGYWESNAIVTIHDQLLNAVAAAPFDALEPLALRSDWLRTDAAAKAREQLAAVVARHFCQSPIFVIKDPRISRVLSLWNEVLEELEIGRVTVIPFRNPLEVAASLFKRDRTPLPKALLLYFHSYLETEIASRSAPRLFVRYDHLLRDWRGFADRLSEVSGASFSSIAADRVAAIDEFLSADLYHQKSCRADLVRHQDIPPPIVEMFDQMCQVAQGGNERALHASFDRLRALAAGASSLYRGLVIAERLAAQRQLSELRDSFEHSTSWRLTAPLRWVKLSWRRIRHGTAGFAGGGQRAAAPAAEAGAPGSKQVRVAAK